MDIRIDRSRRQALILRLVTITMAAITIRFMGIGFVSHDAQEYLLPWYHSIKMHGGLAALRFQVGNYNILYQTVIALVTYLPIKGLIAYKLVSIFFDLILATGVTRLVVLLTNRNDDRTILRSYTTTLLIPTVILNSSFWGQCDSMYVGMIVWALVQLFQHRYVSGFFFLGISLAIKLQTIFIFPLVALFMLQQSPKQWKTALMVPLALYGASLGGLLQGRSWTSPISIYLSETSYYQKLSLNLPNVWKLIHGHSEILKVGGILVTAGFLAAVGLFVLLTKVNVNNADHFILVGIMTVWIVIMFLPGMHDRYAYLLDILLVVGAFKQRWIAIPAAFSIGISCITYTRYLWNVLYPVQLLSSLYLLTMVGFIVIAGRQMWATRLDA